MSTAIRLASPADAGAILAIYAPYIEQTSLTFETEVPTGTAFSERIRNYLTEWPWLVSEQNGRVTGYAYASRYRERTAYQWSVECSVYMEEAAMGTGMAGKLYTALFEILKKQGYRNVYAVINLPNERSVAFHERMGFVHFADYENVGYKLGQWKTVGWWRKILNEFVHEPAPPVKFAGLDKSFLPELFAVTQAGK